jgi:hypothetical protein
LVVTDAAAAQERDTVAPKGALTDTTERGQLSAK